MSDSSHETELEVVREFCGAERVDFDAESIEESSGRGRATARWSDGEVVALEVAELGPSGGLPVVLGEYGKPASNIPVDLLIYCDVEPPIYVEPGASDGLRQLEIDLLLNGGKTEPFRRIWLYERSTERVLCCFH